MVLHPEGSTTEEMMFSTVGVKNTPTEKKGEIEDSSNGCRIESKSWREW
jgi:hypothetical protein